MSVLTVAGTQIPDPSLSYGYSASATAVASLPMRPTPSAPPPAGSFTRSERQSTYHDPRQQASHYPPIQNLSHHQHTRTISSTILPAPAFQSPSSSPARRPIDAHPRVPSNSSPSARPTQGYGRGPSAPSHSRQSSGSNTINMHRQGTTASTTSVPRRSTSGRSVTTNNPTSYVALMRRQKATVWCDRSQNIDPRMAAAQKMAKQRAAMEVAGISSSGRTNTITSGGVVGKIRHGGVPKAPGYVPANLNGATVPLRLSANEMIGDEETGLSQGENSMVHGRTGSGKSSTNSAKYRSGYPRVDGARFSTGTPPSGEGSSGRSIPEQAEDGNQQVDHEQDRRDSEDSFGELKDMSGPSAVRQALENAKKAEDLRRRGSVDERTMSMGTGVRLFVANPDLDD
ncbi:hypothetical protein PV10_06601 [Exophiala mesophila]|uniref:Uncharacterized protein n=1 Tax=Exophiala mesophila TaxID=212818 RepID=A0A0D1ZDY1_EXOME|nr:uncharacterized protein PV10_06601 [Exophiala mesophila]KIV92139.1 hypothetical protein PV10_06601 [Exophiala mesophila]